MAKVREPLAAVTAPADEDAASTIARLAGIVWFQGDAERNLVAVSPELERITGFSADEILGKPCAFGIRVPTVRELLETLSDAGAESYPCHMAMEMMDIKRQDLVPQVQDVITAMDFFEKSEGAQVIFI